MNNIHPSLISLTVDIDKLSFLEGNPRKGDIEAVAKSYKQFGQRKPIVATKDYVVIAGNHQLAAARQLGWDKIAVVITDDDELTAKAFALADNRTAELGSYDDDLLADLLSEVSSVPELMDSTGFSEDDLFDLIGFDDEPEEEQEIEVPIEPKTKLGDMYKLGNHYLYCGDSLEIAKSINNVDLLWLDPPYGLGGYAGRSGKFNEIIDDDADDAKIIEFYKIGNATSVYAWTNWNTYHLVIKALGLPKSLIVWAKNVFGMGKGYRRQHEFCCFYGTLDSTTESDLWNVARDNQNEYKHPTQKPIILAERALLNSSKVNSIVLDPFAGSGSMLIACEKLKRNYIGIELDPAYCDVIIERWENLTGQKAELIEKGQDET